MSHISPILITGVGRRVGLHMAQRLLADGHPVIGHYRSMTDDVAALEAAGVRLVQGELSTREGVLSVVEQVQAGCDSLRAVIHNASSYTPTIRALNDDLFAQYQLFFGVHMMAPYVINESLHPLLLNSQDGAADIVHITDINVRRPNPEYDIYCSTKAGLENLSISFAKRYAPHVQVNTVQPGPVMFLDSHTADDRKRVLAKTPLQIEGGAEAIYLAVRSLLDNHYTTGSSIVVDGGRSMAE